MPSAPPQIAPRFTLAQDAPKKRDWQAREPGPERHNTDGRNQTKTDGLHRPATYWKENKLSI